MSSSDLEHGTILILKMIFDCFLLSLSKNVCVYFLASQNSMMIKNVILYLSHNKSDPVGKFKWYYRYNMKGMMDLVDM